MTTPLSPGYEIIEHTADWALQVNAPDLAALFRYAAVGMAGLLAPDLKSVPLDVTRSLELEAFDAETLLVDWLSELAYWAESEGLVFPQVDLDLVNAAHLAGRVRGGRVPELQKHIKAVTYHNLAIKEQDGLLTVTIVFDV